MSDRAFLSAISGFERALAKVLSLALSVVVVASAQLLVVLGRDLLDLHVSWSGEGLIRLLDEILVIVMPPGMQKNPADLIGLGVAVLSLAVAYWLVRHAQIRPHPARTGPATRFQAQDPSLPPGGGDGD